MNSTEDEQVAGVNLSGNVGSINGDIIGRDKHITNNTIFHVTIPPREMIETLGYIGTHVQQAGRKFSRFEGLKLSIFEKHVRPAFDSFIDIANEYDSNILGLRKAFIEDGFDLDNRGPIETFIRFRKKTVSSRQALLGQLEATVTFSARSLNQKKSLELTGLFLSFVESLKDYFYAERLRFNKHRNGFALSADDVCSPVNSLAFSLISILDGRSRHDQGFDHYLSWIDRAMLLLEENRREVFRNYTMLGLECGINSSSSA